VTNNTDINITTETPPAEPGATPDGAVSADQVDQNPATATTVTPPVETPGAETGDAATPPAAEDGAASPVVVLETTKGVIEITLHKDWAPNGVDHFLELVNAGYYNGAPWFRVIDNFMAQAGFSGDPELSAKFGNAQIPGDPVVKGNQRGFVSYGMSGNPPNINSRSTHFFINFGNNGFLDAPGFAAFGEVTKGIDVADKLFRLPDETLAQSGVSQGTLPTQAGLDAFKKAFPEADYIKKAYVKK
jgi:peptidyl-prolyl cis-trans isomerase A (cyclophilin A)